jgi:hypothetical protein
MTTTIPFTKKPFASSILLWIRTDRPRQQGMDYSEVTSALTWQTPC